MTTLRRRHVGARRMGVLSLVALLALAACSEAAPSGRTHPTHPPTATATPRAALPTFSDWRAAYLATDGHLHAVSLDGTVNATGALLPKLDSNGLTLGNAGVAPDGHSIAYDGQDAIFLDAASAGAQHDINLGGAVDMYWSPDSSRVAIDGAPNIFLLLSPGESTPMRVTIDPAELVSGTIGWLDTTHLAVLSYKDATHYTDSRGDTFNTAVTLAAVDVSTGALRPIAHIQSPGLGGFRLTLSPDGKEALFSTGRFRDHPYTPLVEVIDTATGAVQALPNLAHALQLGLTSVAWRPGSEMVAASTGYAVNGDLQLWMFDLAHDSASHLVAGQYAARWSPDGGTLVTATIVNSAIGATPHDVTAIRFDADGHTTTTLLTHDAIDFPFFGFIRTA